ncbi:MULTISPECIES: hypothetical protein [unclassified Streptomyces]|uniref:hypothetical protein n=1 Tax=unclassified Streptomyces TaxID=2593676 RepID=UPI0038182823
MNASHGFNTLVPLASNAAGELNQDKVTPGLLGFVIFAAIAIGLWLLMKNMGKQMKKIDFTEEPAARPPHEAPAASPSASPAASASSAPEPPRP